MARGSIKTVVGQDLNKDFLTISPVSDLVAQSSPDISPASLSGLTTNTQAPGVIGDPARIAANKGNTFYPFIKEGNFTTAQAYSRAFRVENVVANPGMLAAAFNVSLSLFI